jgi:hypothetical protein
VAASSRSRDTPVGLGIVGMHHRLGMGRLELLNRLAVEHASL